ncbi:GTP cyclohydrolase II [Sneathiella aquimaris]|uniref:GTP cyclohydrolase II n=1 Tax=Sneathiella aquimaris TaxID=2599305 RepID=UPI00146AAD4E|nr:GTP cyclohydrolase II [Sneathiella aquimaris]
MTADIKTDPDTKSLRRVDRAIADLRRGLPVVIHSENGAVVALSTEMAFDAELEKLAAMGEAPFLALTAHRANVLHIKPTGENTIRVKIEDWMDVPLMRALADATHDLDHPFRGPFTRLKGAVSKACEGSIKLAKLARLLPSTLVSEIDADTAEDLAANEDLGILHASEIFQYDERAAFQLHPVAGAWVPLQGSENTHIQSFRPIDGGIEHLAILIGDPNRHEPVLARLHSECFTGDLIGSLKCDCGEQLRGAIKAIADEGSGVLLYLAQEGRGIGLINKLRAYKLQKDGFDTIDANERLGFDADERVFRPAAEMLKHLGFNKVRLMTNNPEKVEGLDRCGIDVVERVVHKFPSNSHNELYLATKRKKSGHYL